MSVSSTAAAIAETYVRMVMAPVTGLAPIAGEVSGGVLSGVGAAAGEASAGFGRGLGKGVAPAPVEAGAGFIVIAGTLVFVGGLAWLIHEAKKSRAQSFY